MDDRGFAGAQFLAVALFIAAAGVAMSLYLGSFLAYQKKSVDAEALRQTLERAARAALDLMAKDLDEEADSPHDLVWSELADVASRATSGDVGGAAPEVTLTVRDVSSGLNPNFVRKDLLEKTSLGRLMDPRCSPQSLQQFREDEGLSTQGAFYSQFFTPEARSLVTCYGWANLNITDEFVLRSLYASLTGYPAGAEVFHTKVQGLLMAKRLVQRSELASFLGADAAALFPVICVEPPLNINYVDPLLLTAILGDPDYGLKDPEAHAAAILDSRAAGALTASDIQRLLGVQPGHILLQYFGAHTWFWEVDAQAGGQRCSLIAARIPSLDAIPTSTKAVFRVVETRFER